MGELAGDAIKKLTRSGQQVSGDGGSDRLSMRSLDGLGAEACRFDQAHLIAPGSEFSTLITLDHHPATGFNPDHPGPHPAKGSGFQHLDDITGL